MSRFPVFVGIIFFLLLATVAVADFNCQNVWKGPSKDNKIEDCLEDEENIKRTDNLTKLFVLLVPIVGLVFMLFFFPAFWIGREFCGCCGSSNRRPGAGCCCQGSEWDDQEEEYINRAYPAYRATRIRRVAYLLFLVSLITFVLATTGGVLLHDSYVSFYEGLDGIIDWILDKSNQVESDLTVDGYLISGIDPYLFNDIRKNANKYRVDIHDTKQDTDELEDNFQWAVVVVSLIAVGLLALPAIYAACDIRRCFPACTTCIYFAFFVIFCLFSIVFLVVGIAAKEINDEVNMQKAMQPGIIQWYLVPQCEAEADFGRVEEELTTAERENSIRACNEMLKFCSPNPTFNSNDANVIFICGLTNPTTQCTTLNDVQTFFDGAKFKDGVAEGQCESLPNDQCTMKDCGKMCTNSEVKIFAANAAKKLRYATQVLKAIDRVKPLLDCEILINKFTEPLIDLPKLRDGANLVGSACGILLVTFALGIGILFKGQKLFFKPVKYADRNEPTG